MSDASKIVDVYSNLAAHTAVSQEELAIAMSKTASSMESVGSTFEETSAMIGTMVAVTRESSTNIGTALKSIASRYGEMKKDMSAVVDAEGEAISYNKVDAALQSIGISMKTTDGQFREFTDVIIELGEKWDELDSVQ
jgi:TP901 family phage tail tape measure protein